MRLLLASGERYFCLCGVALWASALFARSYQDCLRKIGHSLMRKKIFAIGNALVFSRLMSAKYIQYLTLKVYTFNIKNLQNIYFFSIFVVEKEKVTLLNLRGACAPRLKEQNN